MTAAAFAKIAAGIQRKPVPAVCVALPMPPSLNALWRTGRGRVHRSVAYREWLNEAGWALCQAKPGCVRGPYALRVMVCRAETRMDLGNIEKCVSDLLQAHGVIENDRLAEHIALSWGAPAGIVVSVASTREKEAA